MKFFKITFFFLFCVLATAAMAQPATKDAPTFETYKKIPAYSLQDLSGGSFMANAVQQKNKTLVVVYFSPTCSHCISFTENLTASLKRFSRQVQFLFVSAYPVADIRSFAATQGLLKMPNFKMAFDADFALGRFYLLKEIPAIFVYNPQGKLARHFDSHVVMNDLIAATNH